MQETAFERENSCQPAPTGGADRLNGHGRTISATSAVKASGEFVELVQGSPGEGEFTYEGDVVGVGDAGDFRVAIHEAAEEGVQACAEQGAPEDVSLLDPGGDVDEVDVVGGGVPCGGAVEIGTSHEGGDFGEWGAGVGQGLTWEDPVSVVGDGGDSGDAVQDGLTNPL